MMKIGFIGGGKMAQAMAKGFIAAGLSKAENMIASCHPADQLSAEDFASLGAQCIVKNVPVVEKSDIVFVSVKPSVVPIALGDVKPVSNGKLFLSIAMGVTIRQLEMRLAEQARVVRVMPNTPAIIRKGCSVFVRGSKATDKDVKITQTLLRSVGSCEEVPESLMDPITAVSGSGPAYVYLLIEALADGGVKMGLPRDLAYRLASQTVLGAGGMVRETEIHPAKLKDDVTSPAGSTAAGLHHLEQSGFRASVIGAVEAASRRCSEIANESDE
ncbi:pyrroline-5-carboxylate reductase 1, mitochondrial [Phlebotomus papatasi]|uniref:pyrroline-5-carboxylate reductase 1, mitochondrial n=1 Tax=Phlebotomus papatasi TaxID=29031 RepID=UPI002483F84A|nr:pyrroline-5-carboxylate reductase 1, mitochondrial [Phlebotomus papatasi]